MSFFAKTVRELWNGSGPKEGVCGGFKICRCLPLAAPSTPPERAGLRPNGSDALSMAVYCIPRADDLYDLFPLDDSDISGQIQ